jgi:RimJ/RimL family protein N-acetyltransferase
MITPLTLQWDKILHNDRVLLRPLDERDLEGFGRICFDPQTWRFYAGQITTEAELEAFIQRACCDLVGKVEEGALRSHTLMPGNRRRDTIYYSVLRSEWPSVKKRIFPDLIASAHRGLVSA